MSELRVRLHVGVLPEPLQRLERGPSYWGQRLLCTGSDTLVSQAWAPRFSQGPTVGHGVSLTPTCEHLPNLSQSSRSHMEGLSFMNADD